MTKVVLFGAGASYGAGGIVPESPPLGADLYAELRRCFPQSWGAMPTRLDTAFRSPEAPFEAGMEFLWRDASHVVPELMQQMALYFAQFRPSRPGGTLYGAVARALKHADCAEEILLSTLNYDCVLEIALAQHGFQVGYTTFPPSRGSASVWKLHGSCNFLPTGVWASKGAVTITRGVVFNGPPRFVEPNDAIAFCLGDNALPPQMCLYMPRKPVQIAPQTLAAQQEAWRDLVAAAEEVIIIGVALNAGDAHLWDALASTEARLLYVSPDTTPFVKWASEQRSGRPVQDMATTFGNAIDDLLAEITR